jgi:hypothetical protein
MLTITSIEDWSDILPLETIAITVTLLYSCRVESNLTKFLGLSWIRRNEAC